MTHWVLPKLEVSKQFFMPLFLLFYMFGHAQSQTSEILSLVVDPAHENVQFYWKDDNGNPLKSLGRLKEFVESQGKELLFAMNGGMYRPDNSPQGLFIQNFQLLKPLDTVTAGYGNFYLQPNGIFFITGTNVPVVCTSAQFAGTDNVKFATQSGPMLVIDGKMHPAFIEGSKNLHIRNGVGVLPGNRLLFAMSTTEINFYDFATFFMQQGCKNALYLDGFVSRTYLPAKNQIQTDGNFGVIIGLTK